MAKKGHQRTLMETKKVPPRAPKSHPKPGYRGMAANQVVAYNLARARELRGLTQEEAAAVLEPFLGVRWSKASFSQAERSVAGKFVRKFDADEVVAFARAFDLPVTWFYLPPLPPPDGTVRGGPSKAGAKAAAEESALLVDLVFGDDRHRPVLEERLRQFLTQAGAARLTRAQRQVSALAASRVDALVGEVLGEIDEWESLLRTVADKLDVLRTRARQAVEAEMGAGAGGAEGSGRPAGAKP
jgi:hypothetical protein